ncbi:hypothetical protein [Marinobacterium jannaschii]|uniref:hypothetical protein n=1 Tax=Marinobacterium jannaschii TaxID=64970 RepID=UPI0004845242|nr:hypothetical protein [Marinobacterium jannaschii]
MKKITLPLAILCCLPGCSTLESPIVAPAALERGTVTLTAQEYTLSRPGYRLGNLEVQALLFELLEDSSAIQAQPDHATSSGVSVSAVPFNPRFITLNGQQERIQQIELQFVPGPEDFIRVNQADWRSIKSDQPARVALWLWHENTMKGDRLL